MGPRGKYGAWLRGKLMVTNVGGSIFMHAGIPPATAPAKLDELNDKVKAEVQRMDRYVQRLVDKKLALPFFTLRRSCRCRRRKSRRPTPSSRRREGGKELDRSTLDVALLTEAQES